MTDISMNINVNFYTTRFRFLFFTLDSLGTYFFVGVTASCSLQVVIGLRIVENPVSLVLHQCHVIGCHVPCSSVGRHCLKHGLESVRQFCGGGKIEEF